MATRTAYQKQADKRTKEALKLRARFDARVRKHALALLAALAGAEDARARLNQINLLYGVDLSTETLMVHDMRVSNLSASITPALTAYAPGEEVQLFNPTPNGNGGAMLPTQAVFGEQLPRPESSTYSQLTVLQLRQEDTPQGVNLYVKAGSPTPPIQVRENFMGGEVSLNNNEEKPLALRFVAEGERVLVTFTDAAGTSSVHEIEAIGLTNPQPEGIIPLPATL